MPENQQPFATINPESIEEVLINQAIEDNAINRIHEELMDDVMIGNTIDNNTDNETELANFADNVMEAEELLSPLESSLLLFYDGIIEYSPIYDP